MIARSSSLTTGAHRNGGCGLFCGVFVLLAAFGARAEAQSHQGDGAYGRFDHGLVFHLAAGASWTPDEEPAVAFEGQARALFLGAAGPQLQLRAAPDRATLLVAGVSLRPLFPALFLLDMSTGNEWLDTFIQSVGVDVGVAFYPSEDQRAFALGLGLSVPLVLHRPGPFDGLALRLHARRIDRLDRRDGPDAQGGDWEFMATIDLALGVRFSAGNRPPPGYRPR